MVPPCSGRISRVRPYSRANQLLHYRTITFCGWPFNAIRAVCWLIRVRSALLTESLLLSFPLATKMFQFTRFAPHDLYIQSWVTHKSRVAPFGNPRIITWLPVPLGLSQVPRRHVDQLQGAISRSRNHPIAVMGKCCSQNPIDVIVTTHPLFPRVHREYPLS